MLRELVGKIVSEQFTVYPLLLSGTALCPNTQALPNTQQLSTEHDVS